MVIPDMSHQDNQFMIWKLHSSPRLLVLAERSEFDHIIVFGSIQQDRVILACTAQY